MKTLIATLVLSLATVTLFTGCKKQEPAAPETPEAPQTPEAPEAPEAP